MLATVAGDVGEATKPSSRSTCTSRSSKRRRFPVLMDKTHLPFLIGKMHLHFYRQVLPELFNVVLPVELFWSGEASPIALRACIFVFLFFFFFLFR